MDNVSAKLFLDRIRIAETICGWTHITTARKYKLALREKALLNHKETLLMPTFQHGPTLNQSSSNILISK